ncbi:MAG: hypothetical protein EBT99_15530, partial [Betaproteobacteria bacterium]|nr:hypothetical protein [Betaproteobacteria bacterium]
ARKDIAEYIAWYNDERPHSSLDGQTPTRVWLDSLILLRLLLNMKLSVRPALTTAPVVRGLDTDHDHRRGQRCILLNRPVSLINRGKPVQINRATSENRWEPSPP